MSHAPASTTHIIGIDCATNPRRVGIARAIRADRSTTLIDARVCGSGADPGDLIAAWVQEAVPASAILALDAPLGWPEPMGKALHRHQAGNPLDVQPNSLFRRATDRDIATRFGKTPLDVGADRIARTAHAALELLAGLCSRLSAEIALGWTPGSVEGIVAIEVYPAATLLAHGASIKGYKAKDGGVSREAIAGLLRQHMDIDTPDDPADWPTDALDAAVCVLAGLDYAAGEAGPPTEEATARKEGWIWARQRRQAEGS